MGGPLHGTLMDFPGAEPPAEVPVNVYYGWEVRRGRGRVTTFTYTRTVSTLDDGPLWVFVPKSGMSEP